jgi:hypothetical protein
VPDGRPQPGGGACTDFHGTTLVGTGQNSAQPRAKDSWHRAFQTVFGTTSSNGHLLEWASLLAIVVYPFTAWVVSGLIRIAATTSQPGRHRALIASAPPQL